MSDDTQIYQAQQHRDRWSWQGSESGVLSSRGLSIAELKEIDLFREIDADLLERMSPDIALATWHENAVLYEEGSYIDLAFYVLAGEVAVYLASKQPGGGAPMPIFGAQDTVSEMPVSQVLASPRVPIEPGQVTLLSVMDFDLPSQDAAVRLGPGEFFGEIGALSGWPQSVTARTVQETRLLQIRLPALRLLKRRSGALKSRLDARYRQQSLLAQLVACPLLRDCPDTALAAMVEHAALVSCEPGDHIVDQDAATDAVYLVRSGFMRVSRRVEDKERTVSYLSKGMTFGEIELLIDGATASRFSLSSVGYGELVKIPADDLRVLMRDVPPVGERLWQQTVDRIKETGAAQADSQRSEFINQALDRGLVEGNSILVIDLDHCTRCDDCVRACADTHDGRPRFVREGERLGNLLIARSCYHCQDPVCLIGCPTGAIHRANVGDVVAIQEPVCIGCGTCARNCPYDAIVMHDTGESWPATALPRELRGTPRAVASKCDLCHTSSAGPACVRNCPQHCAVRVGSIDEFARLKRGDREWS